MNAMASVIALGILCSAQPPDEATRIIEQAVRAKGDVDKFKNHVMKVSGTKQKTFRGQKEPIINFVTYWDSTLELLRDETEWDENGKHMQQVIVANHQNAWINRNGESVAITPAIKGIIADARHRAEMGKLESLLKSVRYKLALLPSMVLDGEKYVGVRVVTEGKSDIDLYFHVTNFRLEMLSTLLLSEDGRRYAYQKQILQYQIFHGVVVATKTCERIGDNIHYDQDVKSVEFIPADKAAHLFEKP